MVAGVTGLPGSRPGVWCSSGDDDLPSGAGWPAWGQAAARLRERTSRNRCDWRRWRDGRRRGVARQPGAHLGCWPAGGYPVPARRASGPANQPTGIVAAVELTSYKVPGRRERGAGIRGRHHDGRRSL